MHTFCMADERTAVRTINYYLWSKAYASVIFVPYSENHRHIFSGMSPWTFFLYHSHQIWSVNIAADDPSLRKALFAGQSEQKKITTENRILKFCHTQSIFNVQHIFIKDLTLAAFKCQNAQNRASFLFRIFGMPSRLQSIDTCFFWGVSERQKCEGWFSIFIMRCM